MNLNKNILDRFRKGKFSFRDYRSVSSYFEKDQYDEKMRDTLYDDWNKTRPQGNSGFKASQVLEKLHRQIRVGRQRSTAEQFIHVFSRIAAVLILPAILTIGILASNKTSEQNQNWAKIVSPVGSRTQFQLPDGSSGWLNSGSSIKYPIAFNGNRRVEVSGEVWFSVVHKKKGDFKVSTRDFEVSVLGTEFNVISYPDEESSSVILERGKVAVRGLNRNFKAEIEPNEQITYNKQNNEVVKATVDAEALTSWRNGLLVFKNQPMSEIAKVLERKFNVDIVLNGDELENYIFRATFRDEKIEEILTLMASVAPIRYKIYDRQKLANDEFQKEKIEMWLN
ncbi:FecR family protein [Mangrovibacterium lignilyticum]|uniref:FecR family protein n=1 Tax=Mangrovibacterium lignilyticum TaxID=2668052 RepID=UPI0013D53D23|nr:FecR domain-containing protein [Mangrovibacterium lignilyticum]